MKKVVLIGVGKLGVRHLEGILISQLPSIIWVVDTNDDSISNAYQLTTSINHSCTLNFCEEIPGKLNIDLAIIATNSRNRFEIVKKLFAKNSVKNLVLEKIIFPIPSEYTKFKNLIDGFNTTCFVNLPRRLFPHYQLIKEFTLNSNSFEATITGSSWGLLSNSLHFIDLIHFLFFEKCDFIELGRTTDFFPSKRDGYIEANGGIQLNYAKRGKVFIECKEGNFNGISILLNFDGKQIEIQENIEGFMKFSWESHEREIQSLMVTKTTSTIFSQLVNENRCNLPVYNDIYKEHQLFIQEIKNKFQEVSTENEILIT